VLHVPQDGNYASKCPEKNKRKGKTQTTTSMEIQIDDFATKFEKELSLVSCLSTSTNSKSAWYLDNGASNHMIEAQELFNNLMEDSGTHVELGDEVKYAVKGKGTIMFKLESRILLETQDVLYVLELKKNILSISVLEDRVFVVMFKKGKVLIH
jgi:hypothetical protein